VIVLTALGSEGGRSKARGREGMDWGHRDKVVTGVTGKQRLSGPDSWRIDKTKPE